MQRSSRLLLLLWPLASPAAAQSVQQVFLQPSPSASLGEGFGADVCSVSDVDNDNIPDIAVYAKRSDELDPSIRVLSGADRSIVLSIDLGPVGGVVEAGDPVVIASGNGSLLLVGQPAYGTGGVDASPGRVQVFDLRTGELVHLHEGTGTMGLGAGLAAVGDVDGDLVGDYALGAPGGGIAASGAVYVHSGADGSLIRLQLNPLFTGAMGAGLARVGDVNGDGQTEAIAGGDGIAVLFTVADGQIVRTHEESTIQSFGSVATGIDDVTGDGRPDYAIGAPEDTQFSFFGTPLDNAGWVGLYSGQSGELEWDDDGFYSEQRVGSDLAQIQLAGGARLASTQRGSVNLYEGASGNSIASWNASSVADLPAVENISDLDGDGVVELLIGSTATAGSVVGGRVILFRGDTLAPLDVVEARATRGGHAVAILGDVDGDGIADTALGAPHDDSAVYDGGTVRVRSGADGSELWRYEGITGAQAGYALASISDLDGDGVCELAVGEPRRMVGSLFTFARAGAVTVLSGVDGSILMTLEGEEGGDRFGAAVVEVGDVDGDGVPELAVGSPGRYEPGFFQGTVGRVSIHSGATGLVLGGFDGGLESRLGTALAAIGDVTGDGIPELAAGAPGGVNTVEVRQLPGGGIVWNDYDGGGTALGAALANVGDVDGDGFDDLAAGAPDTFVDGYRLGRVRVYSGADGAVLAWRNGVHVDSRFGAALAGPGDVDFDGTPDVAIGSPGAIGLLLLSVGAGRVDLYDAATLTDPVRSWHGSAAGAGLGSALATGGDYDADGLVDLAAGGPGYDDDTGYALALGVRARSTTPYGTGTDGCLGRHLLVASDTPALGASLELNATAGAAGNAAFLAISLGQVLGGVDVGLGALIHVGLVELLALQATAIGPDGRASFQVAIPDQPSFVGVEFYLQAFLDFSTAPCHELPLALGSSHGLTLVVTE